MAGGVGERLWPLSQNSLPKQFIKFLDGKSLLQKTLERNKNFSPLAVIVRKEHMHLAKEQITEVGIKADIIIEPEGRNTAPCAIIAAIYGMEKKAKHILLLPVDHMIHGQSQLCIKRSRGFKHLHFPEYCNFWGQAI
jgi:mannose-1-phosphate guanylyltransferase